jgi:sec-independent protein translocase protein TatA
MTSGLLNPTHILFVLAIALLVLGPKRLPELAKSAGSGMREFKGSLEGALDGAHDDEKTDTPVLAQSDAPAEKTPVA